MPKLIQDRFTAMRISAQRRYQLRREAAGRCRICGQPGAPYCTRCLKKQRELCNHPKPIKLAEDLI